MALLGIQEFLTGLLVVGFVVVSVMMMLVVLIQRPTGGGLSGAFGSSSEGAGQTAFGARTGDALTTATIVIFMAFLGFAIALNYNVQPSGVAPIETVEPAPGETSDGAVDDAAGAGGAGAAGDSTPAAGGSEGGGEAETGTDPAGADDGAAAGGDGTTPVEGGG